MPRFLVIREGPVDGDSVPLFVSCDPELIEMVVKAVSERLGVPSSHRRQRAASPPIALVRPKPPGNDGADR